MSPDAVFFIAEAGVNHNGSADLAEQMVDTAADAGADAVKFQTAIPEEVVSIHAPKAEYQKATTGEEDSQLEMVRRLHFSSDRLAVHRRLVERAQRRRIQFLSSPFDIPSLRFLVDEIGLTTIKLASGEVTNGPLLLAAARCGSKLILSTGMATEGEVEIALGVLAFGYVGGAAKPSLAAFAEAFASREGQAALREKITLLHCVSSYPAPVESINLRAMDRLAQRFGLSTGFSDHSMGTVLAIAAAARGATMLEKHFTIDRTMPGPDHAASLEPDELTQLVAAVREVAAALGNGVKAPHACEAGVAQVARRSLVARRAMRAGEIFDETNLTAKRPATGVSPMRYWEILGTPASRDFEQDEILQESQS